MPQISIKSAIEFLPSDSFDSYEEPKPITSVWLIRLTWRLSNISANIPVISYFMLPSALRPVGVISVT